jgi:hypothetical protein
MKALLTKYAETVALAGALALGALTYSFAKIPTDGEGVSRTSQYCVPEDDSWMAQKIYCRSGPG